MFVYKTQYQKLSLSGKRQHPCDNAIEQVIVQHGNAPDSSDIEQLIFNLIGGESILCWKWIIVNNIYNTMHHCEINVDR